MNPMYGISRIDSKSTHCWWVRLDYCRKVVQMSKSFPDLRYGGKDQALQAATAWRDRYSLKNEVWQLAYTSSTRKYLVSNYGRVKSVSPLGVEKKLRPYLTAEKHGRKKSLFVSLGQGKPAKVSLLVARLFLSNSLGSNRVYFLDGDNTNCRADNLCYGLTVTKEEQVSRFSLCKSIRKENETLVDGIVSYVITGDTEALGEAWGQAMQVLPAIICRHLWKTAGYRMPSEICEDIVMETLMKAQRAIDKGQLRTPQNIEGWLSQIARNAAINYGKKNFTRKLLPFDINGDIERFHDERGKVNGWGVSSYAD